MSIQDELPRSRINLRYRTDITGGTEALELPFRLLVLADLSLGSSVDRASDLDSRRLRSLDGKNLNSLIEDMRMSMAFSVDNLIEPQAGQRLDIKISVKNLRSFLPEHVAASVPKIRALLLLRKLLAEIQSNIDNSKEVRRIINDTFGSKEALESLKSELSAYAQYQLPNKKSLPAKPADQAAP